MEHIGEIKSDSSCTNLTFQPTTENVKTDMCSACNKILMKQLTWSKNPHNPFAAKNSEKVAACWAQNGGTLICARTWNSFCDASSRCLCIVLITTIYSVESSSFRLFPNPVWCTSLVSLHIFILFAYTQREGTLNVNALWRLKIRNA